MGKTQAAVLATAITGVLVFALSQAFDFTLDQAVAAHITTIISTLIALFTPAPAGSAKPLAVSPRTQEGAEVEQPQVFEEEIAE